MGPNQTAKATPARATATTAAVHHRLARVENRGLCQSSGSAIGPTVASMKITYQALLAGEQRRRLAAGGAVGVAHRRQPEERVDHGEDRHRRPGAQRSGADEGEGDAGEDAQRRRQDREPLGPLAEVELTEAGEDGGERGGETGDGTMAGHNIREASSIGSHPVPVASAARRNAVSDV